MKFWVIVSATLCCAVFATCGRSHSHSSSHSSGHSSSTSESSSSESSESHYHRRSSRFRSASCEIRPAPSSTVAGYLHIYQKRAGDPIWIKGGLRGLGPRGTEYALAFHKGYPSPGECDRARETLEGVGGDITQVTANGDNSGASIEKSSDLISLEEGHSNSIIGRSIVVRTTSNGTRVACCTIERSRERHRY